MARPECSGAVFAVAAVVARLPKETGTTRLPGRLASPETPPTTHCDWPCPTARPLSQETAAPGLHAMKQPFIHLFPPSLDASELYRSVPRSVCSDYQIRTLRLVFHARLQIDVVTQNFPS